jgi:hypothetical protein
MKVLLPTSETQTIKIIPRVYATSLIITLRDDSTNNIVSFSVPKAEIKNNYLEISNIFSLKEGHYYDLKVYEIKGIYKQFKERVIDSGGTFEDNNCLFNFLEVYELNLSYNQFKDRVISLGGTFEGNTCLSNFLEADGLVNPSDSNIIYRDKIFCTDQSTNQSNNEHYTVNKEVYKSKGGNNDFIIL